MIPDIDLSARPLAEQAVRALAETSANAAVDKVSRDVANKVIEGIFLHLGVDVNDKAAMTELRDNLEFLKRVDRGAREIKSAAIKTCVGSVIAGGLALLWLGFADWIRSHLPN